MTDVDQSVFHLHYLHLLTILLSLRFSLSLTLSLSLLPSLVHVANGKDLVNLSVAELAHHLHLHLDNDHPVVQLVVDTMPKMATGKWLLTAP